jgi:hypothetical protein
MLKQIQLIEHHQMRIVDHIADEFIVDTEAVCKIFFGAGFLTAFFIF